MFPLTAPLRAAIVHEDRPVRGDVLAFIGRDGRLVFHRLVQVSADTYITRGDTNLDIDAPVPKAAAIGVIRAIGWANHEISLPTGSVQTACFRRLGLAWAATAPWLRRGVRRLRRSVGRRSVGRR